MSLQLPGTVPVNMFCPAHHREQVSELGTTSDETCLAYTHSCALVYLYAVRVSSSRKMHGVKLDSTKNSHLVDLQTVVQDFGVCIASCCHSTPYSICVFMVPNRCGLQHAPCTSYKCQLSNVERCAICLHELALCCHHLSVPNWKHCTTKAITITQFSDHT